MRAVTSRGSLGCADVRERQRNRFVCGVALALGLGTALFTPVERAQAQDFFGVLHQLFGGMLRPPPPPRAEPPKPQVPEGAYCVRLCDGRYFPLAQHAGGDASPEKLCSAMCPASATRIYFGGGIDEATTADGAPYSKLKNAFLYRERVVDNCTCNGRDVGGTAAIDVYKDPTLRPGDIVVTKGGPRVFNGSEEGPRRAANFVAPEKARGLPENVRHTLASMRIAPELQRAADDFLAAAPLPPPRPADYAEETKENRPRSWSLFRLSYSGLYAPYPP
jgi:Protein of unknown function (DUF2865)